MTTQMLYTLAVNGAPGTPAAGGWLLLLMILAPLIAGFAIGFLPRKQGDAARSIAMGVSLLVFVASVLVALAFRFDAAAAPRNFEDLFQLVLRLPWMPSIGVNFTFGIDSVSLWLILLTTFLTPLMILGTWNDIQNRRREYYLWLLVLEAALIGVFSTTDLILFYVFFEMTLVPLFFLIGIWGSGDKTYAAGKFFIFTLAGSVFTFAGVLYVAWWNATQTGEWTFYIPQLIDAADAMTATQQGWVLLALLAGFAIKVPMFPVHTWLPMAHTQAPTAGSVVLAGVLLKLGVYGLYRFALPMTPLAVVEYAPVIAVFAIIGILYTALICWVQDHLKRLIAYSSVSHMGFCILGLFALNDVGVGGSIIYMINHGISTGALFLCVGMLYSRTHTMEMDDLDGMGKRMPIWSTFMVIFVFASVGLPGLNGFVGEFLTIFGAFTSIEPFGVLGPWFAAAAAIGLILGAIYLLYMVGRVIMGPVKVHHSGGHGHGAGHGHHELTDLNGREILTLAPLAVACLALGLYPTPLLRSFEGSIAQVARPARAVLAAPAVVDSEIEQMTPQQREHETIIPAAAALTEAVR